MVVFSLPFGFFRRLLAFFREMRQFLGCDFIVQVMFNSYFFLIGKKLCRVTWCCSGIMFLVVCGGCVDGEP